MYKSCSRILTSHLRSETSIINTTMSSTARFNDPPPYVPPKAPGHVILAVVPIQFVVACDTILRAAREAILNNTNKDHFEKNPSECTLYDSYSVTQQILQNDYTWPLVVDRDASLATNIHKIEAEARMWLDNSPLFIQHRSDLELYLTAPITFKPKRYIVDNGGLLQMREERIALREQVPQVYLDCTLSVGDLCSEEHGKAYREYLTMLAWLEKAPRERMYISAPHLDAPREPDPFEYNPPGYRW